MNLLEVFKPFPNAHHTGPKIGSIIEINVHNTVNNTDTFYQGEVESFTKSAIITLKINKPIIKKEGETSGPLPPNESALFTPQGPGLTYGWRYIYGSNKETPLTFGGKRKSRRNKRRTKRR